MPEISSSLVQKPENKGMEGQKLPSGDKPLTLDCRTDSLPRSGEGTKSGAAQPRSDRQGQRRV